MNVLMFMYFRTTILFKRITAIFLSLLLCQSTFAQSAENQGMVFEGNLTDSNGDAIDLQGQQLYYYITAFDALSRKCILYAESSTSSGDAEGDIQHRYGSGNAVVSPVSYNHTFSNSIFSGVASGKLADGSGNACSIVAAATRYVDVYSAVLDVTGSIVLGATPYSQYANNANSLNGKLDTDFILATSLTGGTGGQVLSRSGANGFSWITLPTAASGVTSIDLGSASATGTIAAARLPDVVSAGTYVKVAVDSKGRVTSATATLTASDIPNHDTSKITTGILPTARGGVGLSSIGGANQLLAVNNTGTGLEYKAFAGGIGINVSTGSGAVNVNLNLASSHVVTALGYTPANLAGDIFNGDTSFLGNVGIGTSAPTIRLDVMGSIRVGNGGESCIAGRAGTFRYNSGNMEYCNGTAWQSLSIAGLGGPPTGSATGDLTGSYPAPTIASGAVTNSKIANATITYAKLSLSDNDIPQSKINGLGASFTAKENSVSAGTTSQYYRGDKTWQMLSTSAVSEGTQLYYTDARVRLAPLTGYTSGSDTTVVAADTFLQAISKLQGQINARWQTMNSDMYFNTGAVTIGSNTFPYAGVKLFVKNANGGSNSVSVFEQWDDSTYNNVLPVMTLSRRLPAGSTPQNGFGSSMIFTAEDSAKGLQGQAMIASQWVNATNGSSYAGLFFGTKDAAGNMSAKVFIDQSGFYASSNITASGSVRMGGDGSNTNHTCTNNESGKQRYNSTYKAMEFCDGTNWRGITGVTYCDTGYSLVGNAGTASAYCMDTNVGSPQDYEMASALCNSRNPSTGSKAKVCSVQQMDFACENYNTASPTFSNLNNTIYHWTSNATPVGSNTNYPKNVFVAYNSANGSTCHIKPTTGGSPYNGRLLDSDYINNSKNFRCCYE